MNIRTLAAALALTLALGAPVRAQSSKWSEPYDKGRKAFESGNYAEAVAQLERAVAADPKAERNKIIEGVFRADYFPYYYLALAYVELGQFDKAQQNLDKARRTLSRQQQAKFDIAETKIKEASGSRPAQRNADFDTGVRDAEASLGGKQFAAALRKFDQLRATNPAEYAKAGLAARRDEAVKGLAGELISEARTSLQAQKYRDALTRLQQADLLLPGQKPVTDLIAEVKKREDDAQRLKTGAESKPVDVTPTPIRSGTLPETKAPANPEPKNPVNTEPKNPGTIETKSSGIDPRVAAGQRLAETARRLVTQGKYAEADAAYASALSADATNQEAGGALEKARKFKRLRDQALRLNTSGNARNVPAAQKLLVDARNVDAARFEREGLGPTLDALTTSNGQDPSRLALQEALLALLTGDAQKSIAILEPAVSRGADRNAPLHAYLGVAYATRALSAPKPDDRTRLRDKAVEQFKLAKATEPGYQLSPRVVSPAILSIYESARR